MLARALPCAEHRIALAPSPSRCRTLRLYEGEGLIHATYGISSTFHLCAVSTFARAARTHDAGEVCLTAVARHGCSRLLSLV